MRTQLERDLQRRIGDKLAQWGHDSTELYGMADLDAEEAIVAVTYTLYDFLAFTLGTLTRITPEDAGKMLEERVRKARKRARER